jgi:hypothetical protein
MDGCFWATVPSATCTCAKAFCLHLSQWQYGMVCQIQTCGCDCLCRKSHSEIFKFLKPLKNLWMFIYWAVKHYRELCRVEDGSVRTPQKCEGCSSYQNCAGMDLPKSALETEDHVPKAEHIDPIDVVPH